MMDYRIVADSCCDLTPELKMQLGVTTVPFILTLGEESFIDDENNDLQGYMHKMINFKGKIGSACPSPGAYKELFVETNAAFAVTISSNLSGSNASAKLGKELAEKEGADVYVFDSKSASAGELLVAVKIRELINEKIQKSDIVTSIESFISNMKTYFVLENFNNLKNNGRLSKIAGKLISMLSLKPIMGSDGDGNIILFSHARGQKQIIEKLIDTIEKSGKSTEGQCMVITHCNNFALAEKLMLAIKSRYRFNEILVVPTSGLSSMFADDKGVIMAF